jgi:hypothetical protein
MKRRIYKVLNFFAFNLLFFALYLNFIHKDNNAAQEPEKEKKNAVVKGNVLVENPEQYLNKAKLNTELKDVTESKENSEALKLSFN